MPDNKRKIDATQIEHPNIAKNAEKNLTHQIAYQQMPKGKNPALLKLRRAEYSAIRKMSMPAGQCPC